MAASFLFSAAREDEVLTSNIPPLGPGAKNGRYKFDVMSVLSDRISFSLSLMYELSCQTLLRMMFF
jgi:hypothetical protein